MKVEKRENKITAGKMSEMRKRELMAHELQAIFYDEKKLPKVLFKPFH
jgi:hypothetical protein